MWITPIPDYLLIVDCCNLSLPDYTSQPCLFFPVNSSYIVADPLSNILPFRQAKES